MSNGNLSIAADDLFPRKLILTPAEIAEALGVDERTIRRLLDEGEMHGFKVRRQWRVTRQHAIAYIENQ
jgi:excisionase family DNA binding protein